jgi:hypothetical protein
MAVACGHPRIACISSCFIHNSTRTICCFSKHDQEMQQLTRCTVRSVVHRGHIEQARLFPAVPKSCGSVLTPTHLRRDQSSLPYWTPFSAFGTRTVLNNFRGFSVRPFAVSDPRSRGPTPVAVRASGAASAAADFEPGMSATRPLNFSAHTQQDITIACW